MNHSDTNHLAQVESCVELSLERPSELVEAPVNRSPFEDSILRSLRKILRGVALYNKHLASHYAITGPQLICLRQLSLHGSTTPSHLAAQASLSKATISGIIDRLEKHGLVVRDRSTTDKRQVILSLTERGKELAFTAPPPLQERFALNLAMLQQPQQAEIDRILGQIVQMMEVREIDAAPILEVAHAVSEIADPEGSAVRARRRRSRSSD